MRSCAGGPAQDADIPGREAGLRRNRLTTFGACPEVRVGGISSGPDWDHFATLLSPAAARLVSWNVAEKPGGVCRYGTPETWLVSGRLEPLRWSEVDGILMVNQIIHIHTFKVKCQPPGNIQRDGLLSYCLRSKRSGQCRDEISGFSNAEAMVLGIHR